MKKISLLIHLIFGFLLLFVTSGQALTIEVSGFEKEQIMDVSQKEKVNRLKNKLEKRMAKLKSSKDKTEKEKIRRKANLSLLFGIIPFVLGIVFIFELPLGALILFWTFSLSLFGGWSLFSSRKALKKIKASTNPSEYKKEKRKAKIGNVLSLVALGIVFLFIAAFVLITTN